MVAKHLLTMTCSVFLLAGMGSALAQDGAATDHQQGHSYESDINTSQTTQNQTLPNSENSQDSNNASDAGVDETAAVESEAIGTEAMGTSAAATESLHQQTDSSQEEHTPAEQMGMATNMSESRAEQTGRVVGTLIDATGRVQGYVIQTGKTGDNGAGQYVVVPRERVQAVSDVTAEESSATESSATGQGNHDTASHKQRHLLKQMYRQLQKQAVEIHALRQQLGLQNNWRQRRSQTSGIGQEGPLGQVAHVVVDRLGRVQAIVLDSGVILASHQWARKAQSQNNGNASGAMATDNTHGARQGGQKRPAIIIFKPQR